MYIRKELRDFVNKMPKEMKLPKHWRKFVNEQSVNYNLILKNGKEYECTNCGKYFYSEQVEGNNYKKICPFCNNQYDVRRANLKNYFFKYDLACIDNVDNKVVLRYFEVKRWYNCKIRRFKNDVVEYARIIPELDIDLANNRYCKFMFTEHIRHTSKIKNWRIFTGQYGLQQYYKAIYLENMKEKTKGTIYEYSPLKEAIDYLDNNKVDFLDLLEKAKYPSFELLIKSGLYQLAIVCPEKFNQKGCFEKRFGICKKYYKFMKKHDITYNELSILKIIKRANINLIRKLLKWANNRIEDLENISQNVDLIKLYEYSKKQERFSIYSYMDYLRNMKRLDIPLTRKILFPNNFLQAHDKSVKKVKVISSDVIKNKITIRYDELKKNEYHNKIYMIRPAKNIEDIKDEAHQQNNCVYTNYSNLYAFGETDLYFMRENCNLNKSLVTVEVKNGRIRQKYQKGNIKVTKEQENFLNQWESNVLKVA